ncbi:MAG: magnesium transporter [Bacteroidia bacterium]|nr:magnesium transporter [Bacteroidia bacterium]
MIKEYADKQERVARVRRLLKWPNARTQALLRSLHPTELAQLLEESSPEWQLRIVRELPQELLSQAVSEMRDEEPARILMQLHPEASAALINELPYDDAADLVALLPEAYKRTLLQYIPKEEETVLSRLLSYEEDSAGGLMNPDLVVVRETMTKLDALREVVRQSEDMEEFYAIYVVDEEDYLVGYLTFRKLFLARNTQMVKEFMGTDVVSVTDETDQEEVAKLMQQYNLPTLPVVNPDGKLLGRITFDDVMDVIQEENTEDILNFAGVSDGESLRGGWANAVKSRIPWLLVNLVTASVAAFTIAQFEGTLEKIVLLTSLMPVIAGVAGNGATQTLAVTIRRISTHGIASGKALRVILKELSVGAIIGLMLGAIVSMAVIFLSPYPDPQVAAMMGLVVFLAMFANLMLAGFAGSFIPLALERLRIDPAVASSILITALTDVIGFLLLLGLATRILLPLVNPFNQAGLNFIDPVM